MGSDRIGWGRIGRGWGWGVKRMGVNGIDLAVGGRCGAAGGDPSPPPPHPSPIPPPDASRMSRLLMDAKGSRGQEVRPEQPVRWSQAVVGVKLQDASPCAQVEPHVSVREEQMVRPVRVRCHIAVAMLAVVVSWRAVAVRTAVLRTHGHLGGVDEGNHAHAHTTQAALVAQSMEQRGDAVRSVVAGHPRELDQQLGLWQVFVLWHRRV